MGPKIELLGRPAPDRRGWVRRARRAAVVGGAAALVAAGTTTAVRRARSRRVDGTDGTGPFDAQLPDGESLVVTTEDGAQLAVTVAGPNGGPAVVLAHCWTGSRAIWATVARHLVLGGHRVVLYDQRGHGQSTSSDAPLSVDGLGHDLRAVLDATGARDAVLVGHSMGGMTIQSYAALHPEHFAERARAVVLVATAARVLGRPIPGRVIHGALGDGRQEWTRRGPVGRALVRGSLGRQAQRSHIDLTLESFAGTTGVARAGFLAAMATMDLRDGLASIAVPTAVLVGARDLLTPPRLGRQLAAAIPDAQLTVLPGAGHMLPLEAPDRIVDAVRATSSRAAASVAATAPSAPSLR